MSDELIPCSHCGGDIRHDATFCRHCGSSDSDGWKEDDDDEAYQDDFDYDDFVRNEFPGHDVSGDGVSHSLTNHQTKPMWRLVAVVLLLLALLGFALF